MVDDQSLLVIVIVLGCFDGFLVLSVFLSCCYCRIQQRVHWRAYHESQTDLTEMKPRTNAVYTAGIDDKQQTSFYTAENPRQAQFVLKPRHG